MRIQSGNVDSQRTLECDFAPTAPVAAGVLVDGQVTRPFVTESPDGARVDCTAPFRVRTTTAAMRSTRRVYGEPVKSAVQRPCGTLPL